MSSPNLGDLAYFAATTPSGYGLGFAERDKPGYYRVPFVIFDTYEEARDEATRRNVSVLGHNAEEANKIILSSIRAQNEGRAS